MRIIPAIDIINGKCVRLKQGNYSSRTIYKGKPLEIARKFEDAGLQYLHLVDLDGAKNGEIINYKILEEIAVKTGLKIDFGGGIKTGEDLKIAFDCGARQVTGGSIAVKKPDIFLSWLNQYGSEKIILGADVQNGFIATDAWQKTSMQKADEFIAGNVAKGIQYVICTDVSKDGMLQGASTELYRSLLSGENIKLIASGGVAGVDDLLRLKAAGCEGCIVGKAIYEGRISLEQLAGFS